jgi:hypothetical protein
MLLAINISSAVAEIYDFYVFIDILCNNLYYCLCIDIVRKVNAINLSLASHKTDWLKFHRVPS